jgi:hypothetical protein
VAIRFSRGPYPAPRYLTAEKPALILAASPGVGSSSSSRSRARENDVLPDLQLVFVVGVRREVRSGEIFDVWLEQRR